MLKIVMIEDESYSVQMDHKEIHNALLKVRFYSLERRRRFYNSHS